MKIKLITLGIILFASAFSTLAELTSSNQPTHVQSQNQSSNDQFYMVINTALDRHVEGHVDSRNDKINKAMAFYLLFEQAYQQTNVSDFVKVAVADSAVASVHECGLPVPSEFKQPINTNGTCLVLKLMGDAQELLDRVKPPQVYLNVAGPAFIIQPSDSNEEKAAKTKFNEAIMRRTAENNENIEINNRFSDLRNQLGGLESFMN